MSTTLVDEHNLAVAIFAGIGASGEPKRLLQVDVRRSIEHWQMVELTQEQAADLLPALLTFLAEGS